MELKGGKRLLKKSTIRLTLVEIQFNLIIVPVAAIPRSHAQDGVSRIPKTQTTEPIKSFEQSPRFIRITGRVKRETFLCWID